MSRRVYQGSGNHHSTAGYIIYIYIFLYIKVLGNSATWPLDWTPPYSNASNARLELHLSVSEYLASRQVFDASPKQT